MFCEYTLEEQKSVYISYPKIMKMYVKNDKTYKITYAIHALIRTFAIFQKRKISST
jgi:hypothetical protein